MPPKKDNPPLEETMAAMAANISKLLESQTITNENIKATQAQSSSQLDVISKQLAAQYEQTATLISTIAQNHGRTHQLQPPNNVPPTPHGLQIRPPKLNLLPFDGSNPLDWLFQADQYFSFYNITPP
nr:retrotransposon Gag protein [Tanacetum cinerariifolium]